MLQKKKCCCEHNDCFDRSERMFQDKMNDWCGCRVEPKPCPCHDAPELECPDYPANPEPCNNMELAMAYVKKQEMNPDTLKTCADALRSGTLFQELEKPFEGGVCHE